MTDAATEVLTGSWTLDPGASALRFRHKTLWGLVTVKGRWARIEGAGRVDADGGITGHLVAHADSIDSANAKRDAHLRSEDFFDAERHPTIRVDVASARRRGDEVDVEGTVEVKGVREPLTLTARIAEATASTIALTATTEIDRARLGLGWNRLGMLRGPATVELVAVYERD